MAATVPVDLAQFYGFVIRLAQELAYIYGWMEIFSEPAELDAATESQLTVFIGVMSGVGAANQVVTKLFGEMAMRAVAKKIAAKPLAKAWYFIIAKKSLQCWAKKWSNQHLPKAYPKPSRCWAAQFPAGLPWPLSSQWHTD